jgi:hypothetical protein
MLRIRWESIVFGICMVLAIPPAGVRAQEPRLGGRLPEAARTQVEEILNAARADGLPTDLLVTRALEGAAKGAPSQVIVAAVVRLREELRTARAALGETASPAELSAGASALRAGATADALARLRRLRPTQPLTVPAAVLADLVATGVPVDTAIIAVLVLAANAGDADYVAFRRNVQRDVALGASPSAALGVRLRAVEDLASPGQSTGTARGPRRQKP